MATVRWSNGKVDRAPTWEALEEAIRKDQWWYMDPNQFRVQMQKRAHRWSTTEILTACSSERFFQELSRALLVEILNDDDDPKEV